MESSLERSEGSKRCPICGKTVPELFPLRAEDIQRAKDADVLVCSRCRDEFRSAARLEVTYKTPTMLRDFIIALVLGVFATILLTSLLFTNHAYKFTEQQDLYTMIVLVGFTGASQVWNGLRNRYGFTHNLQWSLRTRRVVVGLGLLASCLAVLALSMYISLASLF